MWNLWGALRDLLPTAVITLNKTKLTFAGNNIYYYKLKIN